MTDYHTYFEHLRSRSLIGFIYRRFWLYPHLCRYLRGHVLDVGCGLGDMLRYRPDTDGVDINPNTVEWCRNHGLSAYLMQQDKLPFSNATYDGVILDNVLEHIDTPMPLLAEIHRVIKSGGKLLVGVPGRRGYDSDPDHKIFYDKVGLRSIVSNAGFSCIHEFAMPLSWGWLDAYMRQYCNYSIFRRN